MYTRLAVLFCAALAAPLSAFAQTGARTIKARVVYLEPSPKDPAELFVSSSGHGKFAKLSPGASIGQDKVDCPVSSSGKMEFTTSKDSKDPVAVAEIPSSLSDANLFLYKRDKPAEGESIYQVAAIDNSRKALPDGGTFVLNLTSSDVQVKVGDQSGEATAGKSHAVKRPEARDEYNMAPFMLRIKSGEAWKPLKDSMMRFSEAERYFVIVHQPAKGGRAQVKIYKQVKP